MRQLHFPSFLRISRNFRLFSIPDQFALNYHLTPEGKVLNKIIIMRPKAKLGIDPSIIFRSIALLQSLFNVYLPTKTGVL